MKTLRYWLGRQLRALASRVEPTVEIDWAREAQTFGGVTMTSISTTWPTWNAVSGTQTTSTWPTSEGNPYV